MNRLRAEKLSRSVAERGLTVTKVDQTGRCMAIEGCIRDTGAPPSAEPFWQTILRHAEGRLPSHIARAWGIAEPARWYEVGELAEAEGVTASYLARILRLDLLSPDIVEAILDGRQPEDMQLEDLREGIPEILDEQNKLLINMRSPA